MYLPLLLSSLFPIQDPPTLELGVELRGEVEVSDEEVSTPRLIAERPRVSTRGKRYLAIAPRPGPYTLEMRSLYIDTYLVLRSEPGEVLAAEDDGLYGTHARLVFEAKVEGQRFLVEACGRYGMVGAFTLTLEEGVTPRPGLAERDALALEDARCTALNLEAREGVEDLQLGRALYSLGKQLLRANLREDARDAFERSLEIRERLLEADDPRLATTLGNLGNTLYQLWQLDEAEDCHRRALAIREESLGPDHRYTASSCNDLANVLLRKEECPEALDLFERSLQIRRAESPPSTPRLVLGLRRLGQGLAYCGDSESALPLFEEAALITEAAYGSDHRLTARCQADLAKALYDLGRADEAWEHTERALAVYEGAGENPPGNPGLVLKGLAYMLHGQGEHARARTLYERSLALLAREQGPEGVDVAQCLLDLAQLLKDQGDLAEARHRCDRAMEILDGYLDHDTSQVAVGLNSQARLLQSLGDRKAARERFESAAKIFEEVEGPKSRSLATVLNNLGVLCNELGQHDEALEHHERAFTIRTEMLGPEHPHTAQSLAHLGVSLAAQKELKKAETHLTRSVELLERSLGREHQDTASAWLALADLREKQRDLPAAMSARLNSLIGRRAVLERNLYGLSERERMIWVAQHRADLELAMSIASRASADLDEDALYAEVRAWKGLVSRGLLQDHRWIVDREDPRAREGRQRLQGLLQRISTAYHGGAPGRAEKLERLRQEREELERQLSRRRSEGEVARVVAPGELRGALGKNEALLDFLYYSEADASGQRGAEELAVFVLRPDAPLRRIVLGPASELDEVLKEFLLFTRTHFDAATDPGTAFGSGLRARLWTPLEAQLEGVERIFVCPDGALATLPFQTIPGEREGSYLIEERSFVYLQSALDLVVPRTESVEGSGALLVGDVDYGVTNRTREQANPLRSSDRDRPPLPGTREEIAELRAVYRDAGMEVEALLILEGHEATEGRVKKEIAGRRFIHLATHGFFEPVGMRAAFDLIQGGSEEQNVAAFLPGLQSGILLAGANLPPAEAGEDARLTAEEVAWLDLTGCDLVVLSACDTALGTVAEGENLIGLRRALHLAGARTTISSCWKIADDETAGLMRRFYDLLWIEGEGKLEALRRAQLEMLARNRELDGRGRPETWGAFVLDGAW